MELKGSPPKPLNTTFDNNSRLIYNSRVVKGKVHPVFFKCRGLKESG